MVKGGFSGDSEKCGKPANACVSRGSGILTPAGRMNAATLPNQARYQLRYTRIFNFCHYITAGKKIKDFSVCGHSCGQSCFCAVFCNRGKSRKCRCHKALRRFALLCSGYRHGTPKQCAVSRTAHGRSRKTAAAMGAAFASRRERLSKQRHYNRQAAEKQERESGNSLFCEFRLYGGLDFCYNAENVRKAGTVYANEKKKQSGAADGGV